MAEMLFQPCVYCHGKKCEACNHQGLFPVGVTDQQLEALHRDAMRWRDAQEAIKAAYRAVSGDYTDGGLYRTAFDVIELSLPLISEPTSASTEPTD